MCTLYDTPTSPFWMFLFPQKRVLSVCLCDTNTSKDIHINDTLVTQGLAIFSPDTEQDHQDIDGYKLEGTPVNVRAHSVSTIIINFLHMYIHVVVTSPLIGMHGRIHTNKGLVTILFKYRRFKSFDCQATTFILNLYC